MTVSSVNLISWLVYIHNKTRYNFYHVEPNFRFPSHIPVVYQLNFTSNSYLKTMWLQYVE
jgi:hypothetical protein